jgi:hypothetical protein
MISFVFNQNLRQFIPVSLRPTVWLSPARSWRGSGSGGAGGTLFILTPFRIAETSGFSPGLRPGQAKTRKSVRFPSGRAAACPSSFRVQLLAPGAFLGGDGVGPYKFTVSPMSTNPLIHQHMHSDYCKDYSCRQCHRNNNYRRRMQANLGGRLRGDLLRFSISDPVL